MAFYTIPRKGRRLAALLFFAARLAELFLLILLLSLTSCSEAVGGTYYVDSENGSDRYDGLAPTYQGGSTGPWKSISRVNKVAFLPGDSILFKKGGVWTDGPLEPRKGGAPGGVATIQDSVIGQAISFQLVDPQNHNCVYFGSYGQGRAKPRIDCQGGRGIVLLHNYIIVENLHIDNGGNNMLWLGREDGNSWIIINDVDVTNCSGNAVRSSYGGGNLWLKGLYVYNYGVNGILLNGSPNNKLRDVLVEGCWIENPEVLELEDAITCHRDSEENDLDGNIIIRNNTTLRAGEDGIDVTTGSKILLEGNRLMYSHAGGIYINYEWVNTVEVRGNFLYSNSISQGYGDLTIRSPRVRAVNNIVAGNGHHSVLVGNTGETQLWNNVIAPGNRTGNLIWLREGISGVEFRNNIFDFSNTSQEIEGKLNPDIVFDNNCYFGVSPKQEVFNNLTFEAMRNAHPGFEPHGRWANPEFLHPDKNEPEHFRISWQSPCRDAGISLPVNIDFWKSPRPQEKGYDIGAHEVVQKAISAPASLGGQAWLDKNGNCTRDGNEPGIARLIVNLYDKDGKLFAMEYTDAGGNFRFSGLPAGDYSFGAAPSAFNPGQPLEGRAPGCKRGQDAQQVALEAGAKASGQNLAFIISDTPAVELANFSVEEGDSAVRLSWTTSREEGLDFFEVERSDDGSEFFLKGHSKSLGTAGGPARNYHFLDEDPPEKLTYYRLKMVRKDGSYSYSEWKPANMAGAGGAIQLSPNPFSDVLNITLEKGAEADKVWLITPEGKEVFVQPIKDGRDLSLDLSSLPKGPYYLIIRHDRESNDKTAFPVVKE